MFFSKYLFDLDGVLVDTYDIQIKSTIEAIYDITNKKINDTILSSTITTLDKLKLLSEKGLIDSNNINKIYELKKSKADKYFNLLLEDKDKILLFKYLKNLNCKIAVVTNSNRNSAEFVLKKIGVYDYIDLILGNTDFYNTKPHSEPYIRAISHFGGNLNEYIIFEDSDVGIQSAMGTGAYTHRIKNVKDVNIDLIKYVNNINLNIVIPMAGLGKRFKDRGFKKIKPLINVGDEPMILKTLKSLNLHGNYYFIIRNNKDVDLLKNLLISFDPSCQILIIDHLTEGAASTCYLLKDFIDNNEELLITNCDQFLEWDSNKFIKNSRDHKYDCSILTYTSTDIKNSFVKSNNNIAIEIIEKKQISNCALVGVHYFKRGKYFIKSYENIFKKQEKIKNEYYLSTICNNMIKNNYTVGCIQLNSNEKFFSLGTPNDYFKFVSEKFYGNIFVTQLEKMYRGWFIGDFEPSILKTKDFEVGFLFHKKGEIWDNHYHKEIKEYNLLVSGKMILNNIEIKKHDIFVIDKKQIACPIFLEDCYILCIKTPSIPDDKYIL